MDKTIRFTKNPSERVDAAGDSEEARSDCDPDKLLQCPFDKNHQIRNSRFPYHLIKCRKNHPKLVKELKTCPFNARHLVPKHELTRHIETCEDRISLDPQEGGTTNGHSKWAVPVSTWVNPETSEDWDNDIDTNAALFVWGANSIVEQKEEMRPNNNLGLSIRAPDTLPWSGNKP